MESVEFKGYYDFGVLLLGYLVVGAPFLYAVLSIRASVTEFKSVVVDLSKKLDAWIQKSMDRDLSISDRLSKIEARCAERGRLCTTPKDKQEVEE